MPSSDVGREEGAKNRTNQTNRRNGRRRSNETWSPFHGAACESSAILSDGLIFDHTKETMICKRESIADRSNDAHWKHKPRRRLEIKGRRKMKYGAAAKEII